LIIVENLLKSKDTPPQNWFYGWIIVAVCNLNLMVVFGVRLSFTVFFVALIDDFGWSRADTAFIYSTNMIVFAIFSTLTGIALDKWGARRTFGVGAGILTLGLFMSSYIQNSFQLALTYGGIAGLGITILGLGPQASLVARWFKRHRGLAIGIAFAGTGIGTLLFTPGTEWLIRLYDWRTAYTVLAGLTFATIPLIVIFLHQNPSDLHLDQDGIAAGKNINNDNQPGREWTMREAVRTPAFWLVLIGAIGAIGPIRMLSVHQLAIMVDAGFARSHAAVAVGFSGAVTSVAFILLGSISDRIDRRLIYLFGSVSVIFALVILGGLRSPDQTAWLFIYIILLGLGEGSRSSLVTAIASDLFPGNAIGAINGAVGAAFGVGAAFFPWLAGVFYDLKGNYSTVFLITIGTVLLSTLSLWLAPLILRQNT
jgi:MFS family permease